MAVRIRLKKLGRRHRPFFRVCAMDSRTPRDGRVIEELGYYDPMVRETDARALLKGDRIDYWLSVGAQPSDKVKVLIKKYGSQGTHLEQQQQALERLKINKPTAPEPVAIPKPEAPAPESTADDASSDAPATEGEPTASAESESAGESGAGQPAADEKAAEASE